MVEIKISLDASGVKVEGPINDRLLCFGLLEMAKDVVRTYDPAAERRIVPATIIPVANDNQK